MVNIIETLYSSPIISKIFHTTVACLKQSLADCETILDIGCGPDSPIQTCKNIKHSTGVEIFGLYLEEAKKKKTHNEFIQEDIKKLSFEENQFDAVVMIEVLEHMSKEDGFAVIRQACKWARKKVIVTTPNGFVKQKTLDDNPFQKHLSGWTIKELRQLGFTCKGLAGFKFLRQEVQSDTMLGEDFLASIRWQPKWFWFAVATLSQLFVYPLPGLAFELFCVYTKNKNREMV